MNTVPSWVPASIAPGLCPNGVVVYVYDESGNQITEHRFDNPFDADLFGAVTGEEVRHHLTTFIAAYCGDHGDRITVARLDKD